MDMIPPQAPPAQLQAVNQEALDTISRLVEGHQWFAEQEARVPRVPVSRPIDGLASYLEEFDAFWREEAPDPTGGAAAARSSILAAQLASIMAADAMLGVRTGSLPSEAGEAARRFARSQGHPLPAGLHARELLLDGESDVAMVLTDDMGPGLALLFTPGRGWEAFASLDELHEETRYQVNADIAQGMPPPVIPLGDRLVFDDMVEVGSRTIEGDAFAVLAGRILEVQRERIRDLWEEPPGDVVDPDTESELALFATQLTGIVDVAALVEAKIAQGASLANMRGKHFELFRAGSTSFITLKIPVIPKPGRISGGRMWGQTRGTPARTVPIRQVPGLQAGGTPRPSDIAVLLREFMEHDPTISGLTPQQLTVMERGLIEQTGSYEAAQVLAVRRSRLLPMRGNDALHWKHASDAARRASPLETLPLRRPPPGSLAPGRPFRLATRTHDLIPVDRGQWPATVRHFTSSNSLAAIRTDYFLNQSLARRNYPSGVYVTTLDPKVTAREAISRAISGISRWRNGGNFRKRMDRWIELDTGKLPEGTTIYRVANTADSVYVVRPPALGDGGHTMGMLGRNRDIPLAGLNIRDAVTGLGSWPATPP